MPRGSRIEGYASIYGNEIPLKRLLNDASPRLLAVNVQHNPKPYALPLSEAVSTSDFHREITGCSPFAHTDLLP